MCSLAQAVLDLALDGFFLFCDLSSCSVERLNIYMDLVFGGRELKQGKHI